MTAGGGGSAAAGGPALHIPVLGTPALALLNVHDGGVYIDGTFGAGGYTRAILKTGAQVVALDRDPTVQPHADAVLPRRNTDRDGDPT